MDKTVLLIRELLRQKLGGKIKSFYIGDPLLIPDAALPCISVAPSETSVNVTDSMRDIRSHQIDIALIIDARKYFSSMPETMVGTTFIMETMSKELEDGSIDPASIIGILRDNLTLGSNRFVSNEVTVDYTTRRRTEDLITLEAVATIHVEHITNR